MTQPALLCRDIRPDDAAGLVALLVRGFPARTAGYWSTGLARLLARVATLGTTAGLVLEAEGAPVGLLLLIPGGEDARRVNLSSWYVDPRFSAYAPLLVKRAIRDAERTYINISPAPHTLATIEAQGFSRYSRGRIAALPALMPHRRGVRVRPYRPGEPALPPAERALIERHIGYGCRAVLAEADGETLPFVLLPWRVRQVVPGAQLIWCRHIGEFVRVGGPVGRHLLRFGITAVLVDICGPVEGLPGSRLPDRSPKYARGADRPRTGDLSDTELVMFGP